METERPIHLAMRFSDRPHGVTNVIDRHRRTLDEHGAVWLGKFGTPFGSQRLERVTRQVEGEVPTYLLLVTREGGLRVHTGDIVAVSFAVPPAERRLIPTYYTADILTTVRFWAKLSSLDDQVPLGLDNIGSKVRDDLSLKFSMRA
jgi:hypothetical protein